MFGSSCPPDLHITHPRTPYWACVNDIYLCFSPRCFLDHLKSLVPGWWWWMSRCPGLPGCGEAKVASFPNTCRGGHPALQKQHPELSEDKPVGDLSPVWPTRAAVLPHLTTIDCLTQHTCLLGHMYEVFTDAWEGVGVSSANYNNKGQGDFSRVRRICNINWKYTEQR